MSYLSENDIAQIGFKYIGKNIKISTRASIYNPERIEINDNSRIDDFCILSGGICIGRYVHIAPFCNLAGGEKGIFIDDFAGLAYGVLVFSQSDDYTGNSMTSPLIPEKYTNVTKKGIHIGKYSIIGSNAIIMPGATLNEGTAVGVLSVVYRSTQEWSVYYGNPAIKIKQRSKKILTLAKEFLAES